MLPKTIRWFRSTFWTYDFQSFSILRVPFELPSLPTLTKRHKLSVTAFKRHIKIYGRVFEDEYLFLTARIGV